jgi:hypothetical protein
LIKKALKKLYKKRWEKVLKNGIIFYSKKTSLNPPKKLSLLCNIENVKNSPCGAIIGKYYIY